MPQSDPDPALPGRAGGRRFPLPPDPGKRSPSRLVLFLPFCLLLLDSGCLQRRAQSPESREASSSSLRITCTDGIGRSLELPSHPQRIISLAPSVTEVLYLLGADDRLIGVCSHCDWPEDVRNKPRIGTLLSPNYEAIIAARPDLVIGSTAGNDRTATLKLADFGLPLFVTAPRSVASIYDTVRAIGRITDCNQRGEELVERMKARIGRIEDRVRGLPPVRAFFITWFDPLLAPGRQTFENDVLRLANVLSISGDVDEFYPRYSLEQVIARDPDVILTVEHEGSPLPNLRKLAGWKDLRAVRTGRVYVLTEAFQHPSPRFIDGLEQLAAKLYTERFP